MSLFQRLIPIFLFFTLLSLVRSATIVPETFESDVVNDSKLWLVEFYSDMCGSCKEFAPTWSKLEKAMKSIVTGKVNIDTKDGMKLATDLGVLKEGIPNIRLFHKKAPSTGISIMSGEELPTKTIIQKVKEYTAGLIRGDDGYFIKEL